MNDSSVYGEDWSDGVLEEWSSGVLEYWSNGEEWNDREELN